MIDHNLILIFMLLWIMNRRVLFQINQKSNAYGRNTKHSYGVLSMHIAYVWYHNIHEVYEESIGKNISMDVLLFQVWNSFEYTIQYWYLVQPIWCAEHFFEA